MAGSGESGKESGGLLRSIGRLMRRGRSEDDPRSDTAASDERSGEEVAEAPAASSAEGSGEDEDELVLGPAEKAPSAEDPEDELTLTTQPESEEATGESAGSTEPEEEAILAKLRAAREGEDGADEPLTKAEDEWAASFGAAVPDAPAEGATEGSAAAEPVSPGLSWRPPQEDDEEGAARPASGHSPETPETVEGEIMRPDGETEGDEIERGRAEADEAEGDEAEVSAEAVPLFPTSRLAPDMNVPEDEVEDRAAAPASRRDEDAAASEPEESGAGKSEDEAVGTERPEDDLATAEAPALIEGKAGEAEEQTREDDEPTVGAEEEKREAEDTEAEAPAEPEAETADIGEPRDPDEERLGAAEADAEVPEAEEPEAEQPEAEQPEKRETSPESAGSGSDETAPAGGATIFPLAAAPAGDADEGGGTPDDTPPEGGGLDEGAVEEIVRRLIREEMEGELGQRLSGNIRRIVREEVSRSLLRQR